MHRLANAFRFKFTTATAKSVASAALILVLFQALTPLWGQPSTFMNMLVGMLAMFASSVFFMDAAARRSLGESINSHARLHVVAGAKWLTLGVVLAFFHAWQGSPDEAAVRGVHDLVRIFGLLSVMLVPLAQIVVKQVSGDLETAIASFFRQLFMGFFAYTVALWALGACGDAVYRWAIANPASAISAAVAALIVHQIVRFSMGGVRTSPSSLGHQALLGARRPKEITRQDLRYISAHEAGHALVYAAVDVLPDDLQVLVNNRSDARGNLGAVACKNLNHQLSDRSFAEWRMLVLLAGKLGESLLMGQSTLGSLKDHNEWMAVAHQYLATQHRGIYHHEPATPLEQASNEAKLQALQAEQMVVLTAFFEGNMPILRQLAQTLEAKRSLNRDELASMLSQVTVPPGFPRANFGH